MESFDQKNTAGDSKDDAMSEPLSEASLSDLEKFLKTYELRHMRSAVFERFTILIVSASGFIAALAWDDAFKTFFKEFSGLSTGLSSKFIYALVVTLFAILFSIVLGKRVVKRRKKNLEQ